MNADDDDELSSSFPPSLHLYSSPQLRHTHPLTQGVVAMSATSAGGPVTPRSKCILRCVLFWRGNECFYAPWLRSVGD